MHPLKDCAWIALSGKSKGVQEKKSVSKYVSRQGILRDGKARIV